MQDTQQDHHTQEFVQATILTQYMTACLPAKAGIIQHADHINGQKASACTHSMTDCVPAAMLLLLTVDSGSLCGLDQ